MVGSIHSPSNVETIGTAWSSSSAVSAAPGADNRISVVPVGGGNVTLNPRESALSVNHFHALELRGHQRRGPVHGRAPPCGCRFPVTAEHTFEDFCGLFPGSSLESCIW